MCCGPRAERQNKIRCEPHAEREGPPTAAPASRNGAVRALYLYTGGAPFAGRCSEVELMAGMLFLGRYEAMRLLGEGGMARVHLTRRVDGGQLAAVKVLHQRYAGIAHYRDAFRREIEFLGRIRHPGAVQLYESSMTDPHGPCFAMEYVDGIPLDDLVRRYG